MRLAILLALSISSFAFADTVKIKQTVKLPDGQIITRIVEREAQPLIRCPNGQCPLGPVQSILKNRAEVRAERWQSRAQAWAQREADYLADRRMVGHPMGCAPGATFSGTGMTSNSNCPIEQVPSCRPSYRMTLIAVGVARRPWGVYVSRHWR